MLEYMLASGERHLITDEELAVIEAAKALVHEQRHGTFESVAKAEWAHAEAVDALQALEKGEE